MLRNIFEWSINLIESTIIIDFIYKFFENKYSGIKNKITFLFAILILFIEISAINNVVHFEGIAVLIYIVTIILYSFFFLKGNNYLKIIMSVLIISIDLVIAVFTNMVISKVVGNSVIDTITDLAFPRIVLIVVTKLLLFDVTRIILKYKVNTQLILNDSILLIVMPLITIISMTFMMKTAIKHEDVNFEMTIAMTIVLLNNIMIYYLFLKTAKENKLKMEYELLEQNYESEKKSIKDIKILYDRIRGFRHDLKNHLTIIKTLILDEKTKKAIKYIDGIMANNSDLNAKFVFTDDETLDAILNAKLSICKKENIFFELNINKNAVNLMSDEDTCILLGNLLDNAIESAEKTDRRYIQLKMQLQDSYLSLFVSNSINESVLKSNSELNSIKTNKEHHGFGIKNIKRIVNKYNGMIDFFEQNDEFCCDILLEIV